jgi:purine catabolism regulator
MDLPNMIKGGEENGGAKPMPAGAPAGYKQRIASLRAISSLINVSADPATVLDHIVFAVCQHTGWSASSIMAVNRTAGLSELIARCDPHVADLAGLSTRWNLLRSPALRVAETRAPVVIADAQVDADFPDYQEDAIAREYHTVVILPMHATDSLGRDMVFSVNARTRIDVDEDELDLLLTVSHLASVAVQRGKSLASERQTTERLQRAREINISLLERVLAGSTTEKVTEIVAGMLPHAVVLFDGIADAFHVSGSPDPARINDREWALLVKGKASAQLVQLSQSQGASDFKKCQVIQIQAEDATLELKTFVEPLIVDGNTVGGFFLFSREAVLDDLELLIAQEAKFALCVQLMRAYVQLHGKSNAIAEFFDELLSGNWSSDSQIARRAGRLGIDLSRPAQLLAFKQSGSAVVDADYLQQKLINGLHAVNRDAVVSWQGDACLILLPLSAKVDSGDCDMLVARVRQLVKSIAGTDPVLAVGPICRQAKDYAPAWVECVQLLRLAKIFGRSGALHAGDFGAFSLLVSALGDSSLEAYVEQTLSPIDAYDRAHGTELLRSAEVFIEEGCRYQSASEALGIHVSTLRYRLGRLNDALALDLGSPDVRFSLWLAMRLRHLNKQAQ